MSQHNEPQHHTAPHNYTNAPAYTARCTSLNDMSHKCTTRRHDAAPCHTRLHHTTPHYDTSNETTTYHTTTYGLGKLSSSL